MGRLAGFLTRMSQGRAWRDSSVAWAGTPGTIFYRAGKRKSRAAEEANEGERARSGGKEPGSLESR